MRVLIVGRGVSGQSAYDFLKNSGYEPEFALDEDISDGKKLSDEKYVGRLLDGLLFIVLSPGVDPKIKLIELAKKHKIKIVGEFELGASNISCDIVAVTGTNGKTTTVSLINFLLKDFQKNIFLGGNIGVPVSSFASKVKKDDIAILEASSFQLETVDKFHARVAAILNLSPDHLNRYESMKKYIKAKQNITKNQTEDDFLLINADDELLMKNIPKTKAKIMFFSTKKKVVGCYLKGDSIYFNDNLTEKKLVSIKNAKLFGEHNKSNILCAVLAVYLLTKNVELLKDVTKFEGVEHRIEYVKTINGISFYNDSKATNIDSTIVAVKSFKCGINLILGGSDKGYSFDKLFAKMPKNVRNIAIFGQTKQKIVSSAKKIGYKNYYVCDSLKSCVNLSFGLAESGEVVLLSPACASFDCFSNFEERGAVFKKIVGEMSDYENAQSPAQKSKQI